jgi:DNA-binding MurR/RpiR family transcriptional regulator
MLRNAGLPTYTVERDIVSRKMTFSNLGEGDLVVGVCYTPKPVDTAKAVRFAREKGANTLGIVSSGTNPVAQAAHKIVTIPDEGVEGPSLVPTVTVMQALVVALGKK